MNRILRGAALLAGGAAFSLLLSPQHTHAQQSLSTDKLFETQAGEQHGLAYDSATDRLYTLERATTRVPPLLRSYALDGTLQSGPDTLNGTVGALTRLGLHFMRESTTIGGQAVAAGALVLLRDAALYVLDKSDVSVLTSETIGPDFDTGGLCGSPLGGGGKGLGYSTGQDRFLSTNSCCNCSGVAEFVDGQVIGYIPISVPASSGGGDIKEHPTNGQLWIGNSPGISSVSVLSPAREPLGEYTVLDAATQGPVGVMRLAFDATGDRLWLLGTNGSVYQAQIQKVTSVAEPIPSTWSLALHGVRPNPSPSRFAVSFTLATGGAALLELHSVTGRRVLTRDVGSLGAGDHVVHLDGFPLASGVYLVRLTQDGRTVSGTAVVLR